jgi:TRAP-type C4-dicarboxylate transport system permease small subunit
MSAIMIIPSLLPFLSLILPAALNRWVNIGSGALYAAIMILVIRGAWRYYVLFGLIESTLTGLIIWYAWTWPKQPARA